MRPLADSTRGAISRESSCCGLAHVVVKRLLGRSSTRSACRTAGLARGRRALDPPLQPIVAHSCYLSANFSNGNAGGYLLELDPVRSRLSRMRQDAVMDREGWRRMAARDQFLPSA